ncbi:MAG: twin-arginine translocase subunit TatC, partial [Actinobacteria bacterium]|nr:twin-arginine translocase subunit TatC [Actinomycetota bacterium]
QAFQISKYVSFVGLMVAAFGIGFEFPVLLVFLQLAGVLKPRQLVQGWRVAIVVIVVIAAVITPSGDPITLLLLSVPLVIFYFLSILIGHLATRNRKDDD